MAWYGAFWNTQFWKEAFQVAVSQQPLAPKKPRKHSGGKLKHFHTEKHEKSLEWDQILNDDNELLMLLAEHL